MIFKFMIFSIISILCSNAQANISWINAKTLPIEGKAWNDTENYFDRLPASAKEALPESAWIASNKSAGMAIRFTTNSPTLKVKWILADMPKILDKQAATGTSGLDLYAKSLDNTRAYMGTARLADRIDNEHIFFEQQPQIARDYLLYLPLYNRVTSLEIGIEEGSSFKIIEPSNKDKIVIYGTSIVHGIAASRPGMAYPAIIGRRFDCEVINLGLAASAHMEPFICELLAELNPSLYIIDALPNMKTDPVTERTLNLVRTIRKAKPNTPILLVELIEDQKNKAFNLDGSIEQKVNAQLKSAYDQLLKEKTEGLIYLKGENLLGNDGEATVDGRHPTDLGFMRMAEIIGKSAVKALESRIPKAKLKTSVPNY